MVSYTRMLLGSLAVLAASAALALPQHRLAREEGTVALTALMATEAVPADRLPDPQAWWQRPVPPLQPADAWRLLAGERLVGRLVLQGSRERDEYVVVVPSALVDEVQVWHRYDDGDDWKGAVAGDRVPLSRWPFVAPFPAFPLRLDERPLQLIVTARNAGRLELPVLIQPDPAYREAQTRQAQLSGLVAGLGVMVIVVCVISTFALRRRANLLLAVFAAWGLFTLLCFYGDFAIWLTPDSPAFNDASKHFSMVVLSGLLVTVVVESLDARLLSRWERHLAWGAPLAGLAYGVAQLLWLPPGARSPGAMSWTAATTLACLVLCGISWLKGGRRVLAVVAAVLCYAAAAAAASLEFTLLRGIDLRSAGSAALLFAGVLLIRQSLYLRERYGRDVLGRAAVSAQRDPLTALLSYTGFRDAFEATVLRQHAGQGDPAVMLFLLPGLERSTAEHGFETVERALVRFAASLHKALGDSWAVARLSKQRFAAISNTPVDVAALQDVATRVLAESARQRQPLAPLADFGLRIAATCCRAGQADLRQVLAQLEDAAASMERGKHIVIL